LNLPCYISNETEEELYRLRTNRLAEYGFASFEEALAVYAPLDPSVLSFETNRIFRVHLLYQKKRILFRL